MREQDKPVERMPSSVADRKSLPVMEKPIAKSTRARVKKYRERLKSANCGRLEVWVGNQVIDAIRAIASQENRYTWAIVKDALMAHIARHAGRISVTGNEESGI